MEYTPTDVKNMLLADDFKDIYHLADEVRSNHKGNRVQIRAILEFSNYCSRQCTYCGLRGPNDQVSRYRMSIAEITATAAEAASAGYKTIVLQSGEDSAYSREMIGEIVKDVKKTGMAITLSCGERPIKHYEYWRECGADRYLLKHETADPELYSALHPCGTLETRIQALKNLKHLGYETGSGFMIGLPGQTVDTVVQDLFLLTQIPCDMAGIGPFISHPATPLAGKESGSTELCKRAAALARLLLPDINLPATTALGVLDPEEKKDIFSCGANVIMHKVTPTGYKEKYEIYPTNFKPTCIIEDRRNLEEEIIKLGRIPE